MLFGRRPLLLAAPLIFIAGAFYAPLLLAFPYKAKIGRTTVWSVTPISSKIGNVLARSDALLAQSPLFDPPPPTSVYLTGGGWRWTILSVGASDSFALTRPLGGAIIVNSSAIDLDRVSRGRGLGTVRSLSGVIAHETTHNLIRRRYGMVQAIQLPQWLAEGYPDYVARESSLSDAQVAALRAANKDHPALPYFQGRRRVAATLAKSGGSVDDLFRQR